ncbi:MAG TPA: alpha/beta hydrolase [Polyangiales bacterium]|nr:alpha/beta hydrolase [Polyangiales bacterium]
MVVHGFAADGSSWLPFIAPLLHRCRFIVPDLRGFGRSHALPFVQDCALTQFAHDLGDTLKALQVERAALVGISMGALSSVQAFELGEAPRIERYLHIDQGPVIHNAPDYPHGLLGDLQGDFFRDVRVLLDELEREHLEKDWPAIPTRLRNEFWRLLGVFAAAAFSSQLAQRLLAWASKRERVMMRAMPVKNWQVYTSVVRSYTERAYDLRESFRKIQVPLTVLIGGGSRMYPAPGQRAIAHYAPHATLREIPGVGHMIPYEAPRVFLRELATFLAA